MYYWLRTYLLERRDVANKSELGRMAMAQQRMQQNMPGSGAGSLGHGGPALLPDNQAHQSTQPPSAGMGTHDAGTHGQEPEKSATEGSIQSGNEQQPMQQGSSSMGDNSQSALRRGGVLGLVASAASAFDAAKDIMEALRSKHSNLASELEVMKSCVHNYPLILVIFGLYASFAFSWRRVFIFCF